jgi:glyoxylase-like metal-dependent hydrolase (beta-lactamase superfamily II)
MSTDGSALWEVIAVRYGSRGAMKSSVYLNYGIYKEPDVEIGMDYYFWILRNGEETVLVDTGYNEASGLKHGRPQLIAPRDALAALGVDGGSIRRAILTHLHYDHVGNVDLAPNAVFSLARAELDFWTGTYGSRELFASAMEAEDLADVLELQASGRLVLTEGTTRFAPGITLLEVGGHTPGQLLVVVDTEGGPVVLSSDAIHYYEEQELQRPFLHICDVLDVYASFDTVAGMVTDGATLVPGHDPLVMTRFEPVEGTPEGLAVSVTGPRRPV